MKPAKFPIGDAYSLKTGSMLRPRTPQPKKLGTAETLGLARLYERLSQPGQKQRGNALGEAANAIVSRTRSPAAVPK
jgi:hypothetical protein